MLVTTYVPLPTHPRSVSDFIRHGTRLLSLKIPTILFIPPNIELPYFPHVTRVPFHFEECWANKFSRIPAPHPNAKDSTEYHILMHEKSSFLRRASLFTNDQTLVWLDFSVCYWPSVTDDMIVRWYEKVSKPRYDILTPAYPTYTHLNLHQWRHDVPSWWCCGTSLVIPRFLTSEFDLATKRSLEQTVFDQQSLTWEVNSWARVMRDSQMISQYYCWHDASMFLNDIA